MLPLRFGPNLSAIATGTGIGTGLYMHKISFILPTGSNVLGENVRALPMRRMAGDGAAGVAAGRGPARRSRDPEDGLRPAPLREYGEGCGPSDSRPGGMPGHGVSQTLPIRRSRPPDARR